MQRAGRYIAEDRGAFARPSGFRPSNEGAKQEAGVQRATVSLGEIAESHMGDVARARFYSWLQELGN